MKSHSNIYTISSLAYSQVLKKPLQRARRLSSCARLSAFSSELNSLLITPHSHNFTLLKSCSLVCRERFPVPFILQNKCFLNKVERFRETCSWLLKSTCLWKRTKRATEKQWLVGVQRATQQFITTPKTHHQSSIWMIPTGRTSWLGIRGKKIRGGLLRCSRGTTDNTVYWERLLTSKKCVQS